MNGRAPRSHHPSRPPSRQTTRRVLSPHHTRTMKAHALLLCALLALTPTYEAWAASWTLSDSIAANDFFAKFDWFTDKDPTNGLVLYQSQANAQAANLSYVQDDGFVMRVDTVEEALAGRRSVRIASKTAYSDGVYVCVHRARKRAGVSRSAPLTPLLLR